MFRGMVLTNYVVFFILVTLIILFNFPAVLPHHHGSGGDVEEEADRVARHALKSIIDRVYEDYEL